MIIKMDDESIILNEDVNLFDLTNSIECKVTVTVDGKSMTVKEFRERNNSDPRKDHWGRKAINEMDNELM